jgi:hypothetical protein
MIIYLAILFMMWFGLPWATALLLAQMWLLAQSWGSL